GSVDDDLVPGQEHERGTGGRVLGDEAAEGDVVPGGVLDPGDDGFGAELHEQIGTEFHVDVDGDVVGEHRQRGRGGDRAEVVLDLLGAGDRVERCGHDDRVGPSGLGAASVFDDPAGLAVDRPHEHGHPPGDGFD